MHRGSLKTSASNSSGNATITLPITFTTGYAGIRHNYVTPYENATFAGPPLGPSRSARNRILLPHHIREPPRRGKHRPSECMVPQRFGCERQRRRCRRLSILRIQWSAQRHNEPAEPDGQRNGNRSGELHCGAVRAHHHHHLATSEWNSLCLVFMDLRRDRRDYALHLVSCRQQPSHGPELSAGVP